MSILTAFITGLGTGGLTCMAVQGGLLIGLLARREQREAGTSRWQQVVLPVSGFLIAKLVIYTLFGFLLGLVGQRLQLSITVLAWIQGLAAIFMIITGIRLLWPQWLPWLAITPPASIRRLIRRQTKNDLVAAPIMLGLLTIFIPCGTTLAMEGAALASTNAWSAAGIMFAFILGTAPLFFFVGVLAKGTTFWQWRLKYVMAVVVVAIGFYSLNGMLTSIDSPLAWNNFFATVQRGWEARTGGLRTDAPRGTSTPTITVLATGYEPSSVTVPSNTPTTLHLNAPGSLSCTSIFRIPKLHITRQLTPGSSQDVPLGTLSPGTYTFTCGMGMFSGTITAV